MINLKKEKAPERKRPSDNFKPSDKPTIDLRKHSDGKKQIPLRS